MAEEDPTAQRLITLIDEISPTNLNQTICSIYDLRPHFTDAVLLKVTSHFNLLCPPSQNSSSLPPAKYLASCLLFVLHFFHQDQKVEVQSLLESIVLYIGTIELTRHYDRLYAKLLFFYSICISEPVPTLLAAYRRACDLHLSHMQATVVNCLLKNYIDRGEFKLALSFLSHCEFPSDAPTAQLARYHFFVGHLRAITLDYSEAQHHLQLSLRRAPQNKYAENFRALVSRHLMVVMMLQGQVPSRAMLIDAPLYLSLARSILKGDVMAFEEVAARSEFVEDGLSVLVQRLRSSVILAGLTMIAHCYSRITFSDIAEFLHIGSAEDAEGFCAKASADGLIDAVIDHESGCLVSMRSKEDGSSGFGERINKDIQDCFGIREDTQRTMHEEAISE